MRHLPLKLRHMLRESIREAKEEIKNPVADELDQIEQKKQEVKRQSEEAEKSKEAAAAALTLWEAIVKFQESGAIPSLDAELEGLKKSLKDAADNPPAQVSTKIELTPEG